MHDFYWEGPRSRSYRRTAALRLMCNSCDEDEEKEDQFFFHFCKQWSTGGKKLTGENRSTRGKTFSNATLSTTNPTWIDPGSNPGLRCGRPATNHLSHDAAQFVFTMNLAPFLLWNVYLRMILKLHLHVSIAEVRSSCSCKLQLRSCILRVCEGEWWIGKNMDGISIAYTVHV
jgi:hypothetical protein